MTQQVDVLICGSGSAGLCAATWLARYGVRAKVLEQRSGPMKNGQADGVQCRTVEVFESFGLSEDMLREAYHVLEVNFWSKDGKGGIRRTSRTADIPPGLSHQPHVILNQARLNALLIEAMHRFNDQDIDYGYTVQSVHVDSDNAKDSKSYPVTIVAEKGGLEEQFRAKYVLGCDGAHSIVRKSLGFKMVGDSSDAVWGVMDVYPNTNFPDIRKKAILHSDAGSLMIIPREGGSLVRFYIELSQGVVAKNVKLEDLQEQACRIFKPYTMDIKETAWWSAYAIGQRRADLFTKDYRVFLTGDACHTHSPKAGQGMNVSLQDGYNIGWKLGAVLTGQAGPELLETYILERKKVAIDLIEFDRYFTQLFSSKYREENGITEEHFSEQFSKALRYTAGLTAKYDDSIITSSKSSVPEVAKNLTVGMRFPSTQVIRFCDARPMQLVRSLPADGRWRVIFFAGDTQTYDAARRLQKLSEYLEDLVHTFNVPSSDIDSFIEPIIVLAGKRTKIEQEELPEYFWPVTGKWQMRDLHKVYVDDEAYNLSHGQAYKFYGVDKDHGAMIIVRPDQHISKIIKAEDLEAIGTFFKAFALPGKSRSSLVSSSQL
ncbi:putative phenol 2-monooxygenase [Glonium stellatum]|uniref:Putative phenol 2-monooxygenase n=1 Tax=Glonium stellatum TaxID=574774 RepID=A0A8E2ERW9_9PEZI|nr:putative phenol 2-monooxygenase [Glonium stellatum]